MQHLGVLIDATDATITLLGQLHKAVGKLLAMQTSIGKSIITESTSKRKVLTMERTMSG